MVRNVSLPASSPDHYPRINLKQVIYFDAIMNRFGKNLFIRSAWHFLFLLLVILLGAEILIMTLIKHISSGSWLMTTLLDAGLILVVMFAGLYFFHFRPMLSQINSRKQTESILRKSVEKYRNIFENITDVYYEVTLDGIITEVSPSIQSFSNSQYSRNDLLGMSVYELYADVKDREILLQKLMVTGEVQDHEICLKNKDKTLIICSVYARVLYKEDKLPYKIIGSMRDITRRKKIEEEIRLMNDQLIKSNAEKDLLFSVIAHDLKSPFTSLLGLSEILVKKSQQLSEQDIIKYAGYLHDSAQNLYSLLENLLLWSRTKQGMLEFDQNQLPLHPIVADIISLYHESALRKKISLENKVPEEQMIYADSQCLQIVLRNLVSNAIKFTADKGLIIVSSETISGNRTRVCISDNGIGMDESMQKKLFSLDGNVNRSGTAGEKSTGLGLILCKEFIERQGGSIEIVSKEGTGTRVYFSL